MGTCVSKCYPSPSPSLTDSESPHEKEKLVLPSQSLPTPKNPFPETPQNPSKLQIHPSPPSSSSTISSSPQTFSSNSTSLSSTTTNSSYSSNYSTKIPKNLHQFSPKERPFSNEFSHSRSKDGSNIVILDPNKPVNDKPRPAKNPVAASQNRSLSIPSPRQTGNTGIDQSISAKRARSVSPASRTGRKNFRPDSAPVNPTTGKPKLGPVNPTRPRPINSQIRQINRRLEVPSMEKDSNLQPPICQIDEQKVSEIENREMGPKQRPTKTPPLVEDLNNPLISMDCFIFL